MFVSGHDLPSSIGSFHGGHIASGHLDNLDYIVFQLGNTLNEIASKCLLQEPIRILTTLQKLIHTLYGLDELPSVDVGITRALHILSYFGWNVDAHVRRSLGEFDQLFNEMLSADLSTTEKTAKSLVRPYISRLMAPTVGAP
jgi:hypothetical protein